MRTQSDCRFGLELDWISSLSPNAGGLREKTWIHLDTWSVTAIRLTLDWTGMDTTDGLLYMVRYSLIVVRCMGMISNVDTSHPDQ